MRMCVGTQAALRRKTSMYHRWNDLKRRHSTAAQIAEVEAAVKQDLLGMEVEPLRKMTGSMKPSQQPKSTNQAASQSKKAELKALRKSLAGVQKHILDEIREAGGIRPMIALHPEHNLWVGAAPPAVPECHHGVSRGDVASQLAYGLVNFVLVMTPWEDMPHGTTQARLLKNALAKLEAWSEVQGRMNPREWFDSLVKDGLIWADNSFHRSQVGALRTFWFRDEYPHPAILGRLQLENVTAWVNHLFLPNAKVFDDDAPHPGRILDEEFMRPNNLSPASLSKRLKMTIQDVDSLMAGLVPITGAVAQRLARSFRTSPQFWVNLQRLYDQANQKNLQIILSYKRSTGFKIGREVHPRPVSPEFIGALEQAGARRPLVEKLRRHP